MVIDRRSWAGRRVFVTGHTGFKGGWLSFWLKELGAEVHGYALAPPTSPHLFGIAGIDKVLTSDIRGDIRDLPALETALQRARPEVVFHLAAQSLVRASYEIPVETFATNVMGTVHVLKAMRAVPSVRAAVIITTDKCYENSGSGMPFAESDPLGGADPYSASKACAEHIITSFRSSAAALGAEGSTIAIASARSGNVIGGGDWSMHRLVPDCIRSFIEGQPVRLRYPQAVRPWLHVIEPLAGYITMAERLLGPDPARYATAFNFGPGPEGDANVKQIGEAVARLWGERARIEVVGGPHPPEAITLRLDTAKAARLLGWSARWDFTQTLERAVDWYRTWNSGQDVRPIMTRQIAEYAAAGR